MNAMSSIPVYINYGINSFFRTYNLFRKFLEAMQDPVKFKDSPIIKGFFEGMNLGAYLRKVNRLKYDRHTEYRRHVTMVVHDSQGDIEITIDVVNDLYKKAKKQY